MKAYDTRKRITLALQGIFKFFLHTTRQKKFAHFYFVLNYSSGSLIFKNLKWHGQGIFQNVYLIIFDHFFANNCTVYLDFAKKINFCKFAIFFCRFSKWIISGHQTLDLEGGGGKIALPPRILVFKYPKSDRANVNTVFFYPFLKWKKEIYLSGFLLWTG